MKLIFMFVLMMGIIAVTLQAFVPRIGGSSSFLVQDNMKIQKVRDYDNVLPRRRSWSRGMDGTAWPGSSRIVTPHEFPFVAALENARGEKFVGTLVSDSMIVTLASKVKDAGPVRVKLGSGTLDEKEVVGMETSEMVIHENYKPGELVNDIAMLKLPHPVSFSANIKPVRLPSKMERFAGERLFTNQPAEDLGWGARDHNEQLRSVDVAVIANLNCSQDRGEEISKQLICTSVDPVYKDGPCQSETGAPLALLELDEIHTMIGMLLRSKCPVSAPPVHLRLTDYILWIQDNGGPRARFC